MNSYYCMYLCMRVSNTWLYMKNTEFPTQRIPVYSKTLGTNNDYSPKKQNRLVFTVVTQWAC